MVRLKKDKVLKQAETLVMKDREKEHGDFQLTHWRAAMLWSVYLEKQITADEVAVCMALMKIVRTINNPEHIDSYADAIAYLAGAAEIATDPD